MGELFWVRIFAYSFLPLILSVFHLLFDKEANTRPRQIETFVIYIFAISVGANGIGGAFGHLFLSDIVAEGIGWPAGNPFQLEMGFANLALGILGVAAVGRRGGFRLATIIATSILGAGATAVHIWDIAQTGNLSPGNTIQNLGNILDPLLLIFLFWWYSDLKDSDKESPGFLVWQSKQQPIAGMTAAGVGIGFGIGYALSNLILWTLAGGLLGVVVGVLMTRTGS